MKVVLHIGTHKTGSSAIQHVLWENRQRLSRHGYLYPKTDSGQRGHHEIAWAIRSATGGRTPAVGNGVLDRLRKQFESPKHHTTIISSEEFEFANRPEQIKLVKRLFGKADVKVVLYLRRQDKLLLSEYNQHVRMPETRFPGSIYDFYIRHNFVQRLNYLAVLKKWARAFGTENIVVRPFETGQFANGNLIDDARQALSIAEDVELQIPAGLRANASLSGAASMVLSQANRRDLDAQTHGRVVELLYQYDGDLDGGPVHLLSDRNAQELMQKYAESNQEVARRFLGRADGVLFREPLPEGAQYDNGLAERQEKMIEYLTSLLIEIARKK